MNIQNLKCLLETAESSSVTAMAGRCILEQFLFIEILCVVQACLHPSGICFVHPLNMRNGAHSKKSLRFAK